MTGSRKYERQQALRELMQSSPFYTDEELAERFIVSVQTIRLDRLALGIPELRERIKAVAKGKHDQLRSLDAEEVIGQIIDLELDQFAISILDAGPEHVFARTNIVRGHHIFAQANSLAVAVIDAEVVLTGTANIRFLRQAVIGERMIAKAVVNSRRREHAQVHVTSRVGEEAIFEGDFLVVELRANWLGMGELSQ